MKVFSLFIGSLFCAGLAFAADQTPKFEVSGVTAKPSKDSVPMKTKAGDETLNVLKTPLLGLSDFKNAKVSTDANGAQLSVELNPTGAKKIHDYTASHIDQRVGIVVDGELVSAPIIKQMISGKNFVISAISDERAHELAKAINSQK